MPHLSDADIRISLLFEENGIFCTGTITHSVPLRSQMSSLFESSLPAFPFVFTFLMAGAF